MISKELHNIMFKISIYKPICVVEFCSSITQIVQSHNKSMENKTCVFPVIVAKLFLCGPSYEYTHCVTSQLCGGTIPNKPKQSMYSQLGVDQPIRHYGTIGLYCFPNV